MFKRFIERIIASENPIDEVFFGTIITNDGTIIEYGIDTAYQHEKITYKEHEMLFALCEKYSK